MEGRGENTPEINFWLLLWIDARYQALVQLNDEHYHVLDRRI